MGKVYSDIAVSADGFAAGPNQREEAPLGDIGENWLHSWMFDAYDENRAEVDAIVDSGATIMGRNMFGFVTDGIHSALERARAAAGARDISIAGGASTVNQYLAAGLLDELRLHVTPCILGAGERVFEGVPAQALERVAVRATSLVTHITYRPVGS